VNNKYVEDSISKFASARETIYALAAGQEELEPSVRGSIARYIDEFYGIVDDPRKVEQEIINNCR
jgi:hypothetical protein